MKILSVVLFLLCWLPLSIEALIKTHEIIKEIEDERGKTLEDV